MPVLFVAAVWVGANWPRSRTRTSVRLDDESPAVRAAAIRSFRGDRRLLVKMLDDEDSDVRQVAVMALVEPYQENEGGSGAERARALVRALGDERLSVRREAAWSLSWLGPGSWPVLREAMEDKNPRIRAGAALALTYGHPMRETRWSWRNEGGFRPLLERLTTDPDPEVRKNATKALGR
jgi:HEAT repeat protein